MATADSPPFPIDWTVADLVSQLGDVPIERVRLFPWPGTATEEDLLRLAARSDRLYELVDGVLVEKTMGYRESLLAVKIASALLPFVESGKLGIVLGADGTLRILRNQVRIPDVCFISWKRFPGGRLPDVPIPAVAPDLAIEVLSPGNTAGEMRRKLVDYFAAGVRLVWYIDPATRTARAFTGPEQSIDYGPTDSLPGGDVLPGFQLPLAGLFAE
jgi:Uma2 family endonuclease